jgi:pimeloyl-ACP methyl ester carboxylesterase
MGVQVCLEMFRRHRDRVAGLALLCGSYGNPLRTFKGKDTLDVLLPYVTFAMRMAPRFVHTLYKSVLPTKLAYAIASRVEINPELASLEDFMPYLEHMAKVDIGLFLEMLAYAGRHSAREILPAVDVPTLIVAGEKDGFTPRSLSEEMNALIQGSELLVVEGGTHTAPIERPQLVNDALSRLLARVS